MLHFLVQYSGSQILRWEPFDSKYHVSHVYRTEKTPASNSHGRLPADRRRLGGWEYCLARDSKRHANRGANAAAESGAQRAPEALSGVAPLRSGVPRLLPQSCSHHGRRGQLRCIFWEGVSNCFPEWIQASPRKGFEAGG